MSLGWLSGSDARTKGISWGDGLFFLSLVLSAAYCTQQYSDHMDVYELGVLWLGVPVVGYMAHRWGALKCFVVALAVCVFAAIAVYGGDLKAAQSAFVLKYLLASQSAILWMGVLFGVATVSYWIGVLGAFPTSLFVGSVCTWAAVLMGFVGLFVRWYESYLIGPDVGHIPVSNLYEVFVLFSLVTALYYLFYEQVYKTRQLGAFVMLVVMAAVGFLFWYGLERQAYAIEPLVPALQSWWMKIHVPANFIGYGTFSLAAMVAFAYVLKVHADKPNASVWVSMAALGVLLIVGVYGGALWAVSGLAVCGIVMLRKRIALVLPSLAVLDDLMYKSIAVGFAFFTVATILGAFWAAEAWGAYWQWDPKETWALVVWLNYAAWLHMRLVKGLRGVVVAYWALIGLLVTGFAFLGVNMLLSGLHSYGEL